MYGVRLARHDLSLIELCDLAANLPPGCALWQSIGGPLAWTPEMHLLNLIEFQVRIANWRQTKAGQNGSNKPKLQTPPPYAHEKRAEASREMARAQAWQERQTRRN